MTENKRFEMIITSADGSFHYLDKITGEKITSTLELENKLNELNNENEQLKQELKEYKQPNCKKCIEYSQDGVADYCMSEKGLLGDAWKMFPYEWDYSNAKDCKEYEE